MEGARDCAFRARAPASRDATFLSKPIVAEPGHRLHRDLPRRSGASTSEAEAETSLPTCALGSFDSSCRCARSRRTRRETSTRSCPTCHWTRTGPTRSSTSGTASPTDEIAFIESRSPSTTTTCRRVGRRAMSKPIDELLPPKPEARPRASTPTRSTTSAHEGLLKVGQTTQRREDARRSSRRKTAASQELHDPARRAGRARGRHDLPRPSRCAQRLRRQGVRERRRCEWMRCTADDVKTAITELRTGMQLTGTHHETFPMRREQAEAVEQDARLLPLDLEGGHARRPAVPVEREDALRQDLRRLPAREEARREAGARRHVQAGGRGRLADRPRVARRLRRLAVPLERHPAATRRRSTRRSPLVYFGSFQDLLGRDSAGNIKAKNEWLHAINWDLVVFDEYHFGAWRDTAKELFEGEDDAVAKKETQARVRRRPRDRQRGARASSSEHETEFLPITTRAYLYLSGTPFRALATGEFIEEQIFNWTYTDEQRAKAEFADEAPRRVEPVRRAPGDAAAHLPDARRAARDRQPGRVRRVRPERVLRRHRHG